MATRQIVLALVLTFAFPGYSSAADTDAHEFRYDPSTCKTDVHGKLYIALGRNVLGVPTSGAVIVARPGKDDGLIAPSDPSEPEGCLGNPEQLTGYAFPYAYNAAVGTKASSFQGKQPQVDMLELIDIRGNSDVPSPDDSEWRSESFERKFAQSICSEEIVRQHISEGWAVIRETLPNGFTACRLKHGDHESRAEDMRAAYIARSEIYQTPLGRPFVVNCDDHMYTIPVGDCVVAYVFSPGLGVRYKFQLYRASRLLPIDQVIDFDRGLRASIAQALVKDYHWPEQEAVGDKSVTSR